jgi:hypothetical protein
LFGRLRRWTRDRGRNLAHLSLRLLPEPIALVFLRFALLGVGEECGPLPSICSLNRSGIISFGGALLLYSLFQMHSYAFARLFPNSRANIRLDGQHVLSVSRSHKRTAEWMAVNGAANFDEASGASGLDDQLGRSPTPPPPAEKATARHDETAPNAYRW